MKEVHTRAYLLDEKSGQWQKLGVVVEDGFWPMQEPLLMTDGNYIMAGIVAKDFNNPGNPAAVAISHGTDFTKWDLVVIPRPAELRMWGESTVIVDGPHITNIARYRDKALALFNDLPAEKIANIAKTDYSKAEKYCPQKIQIADVLKRIQQDLS